MKMIKIYGAITLKVSSLRTSLCGFSASLLLITVYESYIRQSSLGCGRDDQMIQRGWVFPWRGLNMLVLGLFPHEHLSLDYY